MAFLGKDVRLARLLNRQSGKLLADFYNRFERVV